MRLYLRSIKTDDNYYCQLSEEYREQLNKDTFIRFGRFTEPRYYLLKPLAENYDLYSDRFIPVDESGKLCGWRTNGTLTRNFPPSLWRFRHYFYIDIGEDVRFKFDFFCRLYKSSNYYPEENQATLLFEGCCLDIETEGGGVFKEITFDLPVPGFNLSNEYLFYVCNIRINGLNLPTG
ncbi:MAG: hypothetical protein NZ891_04775, partial [bacterium]|nr:hypothetical protein [bacterium]MDW8164038.1 hypothetical protein [Candidatus Omnitrophota bacterium]